MSWLESLLARKKKKKRVVAGIMSGTSVNSVDVALCEIHGFGPKQTNVKLLGFYEQPFPKALRQQVLGASELGLGELAALNLRLGELFAGALQTVQRSFKGQKIALDLAGSHGQTIYHHSGIAGAAHASWQVADGDCIAALSGVPTVSDFRVKDIILEGEGAPLTPYADYILFRKFLTRKESRLAILNLGGIANITLLSKDPSNTAGFDLGPANAPLDRLAALLSKGRFRFDRDGRWARSGKVRLAALRRLIAEDQFLSRKPPKSTGTEAYGDKWVKRFLKICPGSAADRMATATAFVSIAISSSIAQYVLPLGGFTELIVAGGGVGNSLLLEQIRAALFPLKIITSDEAGVPAKAREAMAFAIFANEFLGGHAASLPNVTGAARSAILGKLSLP